MCVGLCAWQGLQHGRCLCPCCHIIAVVRYLNRHEAFPTPAVATTTFKTTTTTIPTASVLATATTTTDTLATTVATISTIPTPFTAAAATTTTTSTASPRACRLHHQRCSYPQQAPHLPCHCPLPSHHHRRHLTPPQPALTTENWYHKVQHTRLHPQATPHAECCTGVNAAGVVVYCG